MSDKDQEQRTLEIRGWKVLLIVDEDDHLAIWVSNQDGTQVHDLSADIGDEGHEWGERFTTAGIEGSYNESTRKEEA